MTFNVKDKSLHEFFGIKDEDRRNNAAPYNLMQDEIIIPISTRFATGDKVVFDLIDYAVDSRKQLKSVYVYDVYEYDSVQHKLVLDSHEITATW